MKSNRLHQKTDEGGSEDDGELKKNRLLSDHDDLCHLYL